MQKPFLRVVLTVFIACSSLPVIAQGINASVPVPEYTVTAGSGPFRVEVHLLAKATQRQRVYAVYGLVLKQKEQGGQPLPNTRFVCQGYTTPGEQTATIDCVAPLPTLGGIYQRVEAVRLIREETNETKEFPDIRLPMITIEPNPLAISDFPVIVGTSLALSSRQSLADGSRKSQEVLNSLSARINSDTRNSKEVRAYLQQIAEEERRVLDLTRRRYLGDPANTKAPIFFDDFDRRLTRIIRELGGTPNQVVANKGPAKVYFLLAQMPHTSDSVNAQDNSAKISHSLTDLVGVLTDAVKGLLGMSETGTTSFHWSAATIPQGAEIYISRLDEPETKWAGVTDVKDKTLEYAIWTFRFDWNGCSKREKPDPFLQQTIDLKLAKEGCRRQ